MRTSLELAAPRLLSAALAAGLLALGGGACRNDGDRRVRLPDLAARQRSAIALRVVSTVAGDSLFTQVTGVDADSRGRIYVGDWSAGGVPVFDSAGTLLRTVGRRGHGPGEFQSIGGVQVLPGDSLLVYDPGAARVSVFAPDAEKPAYLVNLAATLRGAPPLRLERTQANHAYVALFRPPFVPNETAPRQDVVRVLAMDGSPRPQPVHSFPSRSFLRAGGARGFAVMPNPFGREGLYALGSGDVVHLAWSDSLAVSAVTLDARPAGGFAAEYDPPVVSRGDVEDATAALPRQLAAQFRPVLADSLPRRWPALRALLADSEHRLWVALNGDSRGAAEWAVFREGGRYVGSAFLPREVEIRRVRGNRVYAVRTDEVGVPSLVVYRMADRP